MKKIIPTLILSTLIFCSFSQVQSSDVSEELLVVEAPEITLQLSSSLTGADITEGVLKLTAPTSGALWVFDSMGLLYQKLTLTGETEIDMSYLPAGNYTIEFESESVEFSLL